MAVGQSILIGLGSPCTAPLGIIRWRIPCTKGTVRRSIRVESSGTTGPRRIRKTNPGN